MDLKPFGSAGKCPKCDGVVSPKVVYEESGLHSGELRRGCERCGYTWWELPMDATPKDKDCDRCLESSNWQCPPDMCSYQGHSAEPPKAEHTCGECEKRSRVCLNSPLPSDPACDRFVPRKAEPELLPCPFCGGEAHIVFTEAGEAWVTCRDCGVQTAVRTSGERATVLWNRRAK